MQVLKMDRGSICLHSYWKGMQKSAHDICSKYHVYQFLKLGKRNYGKLSSKQEEGQQQDLGCIGVIRKFRMNHYKGGGKYTVKSKKDKDFYLQAVTTS